MSRYLWGHLHYRNRSDGGRRIGAAFHQPHVSKTASPAPGRCSTDRSESLRTKVRTTVTSKLPTHFLPLRTTALWGSISVMAEKRNTLTSHRVGRMGWQVRKLWPLWVCNLSWGQKDASELQNCIFIVTGLFRATWKVWAAATCRQSVTSHTAASQQCVC